MAIDGAELDAESNGDNSEGEDSVVNNDQVQQWLGVDGSFPLSNSRTRSVSTTARSDRSSMTRMQNASVSRRLSNWMSSTSHRASELTRAVRSFSNMRTRAKSRNSRKRILVAGGKKLQYTGMASSMNATPKIVSISSKPAEALDPEDDVQSGDTTGVKSIQAKREALIQAVNSLASSFAIVGKLWLVLRFASLILELFQWPYRIANAFPMPRILDKFTDCLVGADVIFTSTSRWWTDWCARGTSASVDSEERKEKDWGSLGISQRLVEQYFNLWRYWSRQGALAAIATVLPYIAVRASTGNDLYAYQVASAFKLERVIRLFVFFRQRESDLNADIRHTAALKFIVLILGTAHWIGQVFFFVARAEGFPEDPDKASWLTQFREIDFQRFPGPENATAGEEIVVALYKGMSTLAAVAYVSAVPRNWPEFVIQIISYYVTIVVSGVVLGALFNFLIQTDREVLEHQKRLEALEWYAESHELEGALTDRLKRQYHFASRGNSRTTDFLHKLDPTMRFRVSRSMYCWVIDHNPNLFADTTDSFKQHFLSLLREVTYEPGEAIVFVGEISRHCYFVLSGQVELYNKENLQRVARQGDAVGQTAFLVGMRHSFELRASKDSECSLLVLSRQDWYTISERYPTDAEQMLKSQLDRFDLNKDGSIKSESENEPKKAVSAQDKDRRESVAAELKKRMRSTFNEASKSACSGDVASMKNCYLNKGLPVNSANHDGRTSLHLASRFARSSPVTELIYTLEADVNVQDRLGNTPLQERTPFLLLHKLNQIAINM